MLDRNEMLELMKSLISRPSPYFEEDHIMEFVAAWFRSHGMNAEIHEYHEEKITGFKGKNVVLVLDGGEPGPTLCMNGHLDTVKLCNGWTRDPHAAVVEGDRVYGLGALDMKSGCASTMLAIKAFAKEHRRFKGKIIATYVSVEEGPFGLGTNALIEDGLLDGVDFSLVTEPSAGFTHKPFPVICLGARGGYGLEIEFFGKSAHAAMPEDGKSAVLDASRVICELESAEYITDPHLGTGTACVVAMESDGGACSVPDYAKVKLFWHIVVGENPSTIEREIRNAVERAQIQCDYRIKFRDAPSEGSQGFMPYTVDEADPLVKAFMNSATAVCGEEPAKAYFQSIGDFNYLGTRLGAPTVIFGAEGENFHGQDEYATLSSTVKTGEVIYHFLKEVLI